MASDSVSARLKAYDDAQAVLEPQIRGLEDKVNDALSPELRKVLNDRLVYLKNRRDMIGDAEKTQEAANAAAEALDGVGFPALPPMQIPANLMAELDREGADDAAARSGFETSPMASKLNISLGSPAVKP